MIYKQLLSVILSIISIQQFSIGQSNTMPSAKYNVLFIMVDDLRPELGCYGKSHVVSPNIDRLAMMGQLFEDAYASMPSCGPSRASLLTGLYPSTTRFRSWNCSQDRDVPGIVSLPMHLRNNGYKTISLGKIYNNFDDGKGSWNTVWKPPISTTEMWDYQSDEGIEIFFERNKNRENDQSLRSYSNVPKKSIAFERPDVEDLRYVDGKTASKAMEMLGELKHAEQPFFMTVGFNKPHLPYNAPDKYWKMYDNAQMDSIRSLYLKAAPEVPEIAFHDNYEFRSHHNIPKDGPIPDSTLNQLMQGYLACISYIDFQIGRILNALEYLRMTENTLIILWSDHGYHLGENQMWGKATNFKVSSRIPLIVKLPNKVDHIRQEGLVESVDIYPTICELLGIEIPIHIQGKSFAQKINDPGLPGKEAVFVRMNRGKLRYETIITELYSYTEYIEEDRKIKSQILYDLNEDPHENFNVIDKSGYKPMVERLAKRLQQHISRRDIVELKK